MITKLLWEFFLTEKADFSKFNVDSFTLEAISTCLVAFLSTSLESCYMLKA